MPDPKSAVIIPQNAAAITIPIRSKRKYRIIRNKFNIIKLMHMYTQITSCIRLPGTSYLRSMKCFVVKQQHQMVTERETKEEEEEEKKRT